MRIHNDSLQCLNCGASMLGRRPDAVWCSPACKLKGNRIIKREAAAGSPYDSVLSYLESGIIINPAPIVLQVKQVAKEVSI